MNFEYENKSYPIKVIRKSNKNTYVRFKNSEIVVTTSYFVTNNQIKKILSENIEFLKKVVAKEEKNKEKATKIYILDNEFSIIISNSLNEIDYKNHKIYAKDLKQVDKLIKRETEKIFLSRLEYNYNLFQEKIPFPSLTIRKMSTRWGVCNRKLKRVTLNSLLIRYPLEALDYVIIHELSHFVHFDHSKAFWTEVSKYSPKYKEIRKLLKD
ncbi:MAG: M48 family metallopeptidase [Erysipelotrichaceae bacterium]|nr:M48 family metallopeptidase [Erysipelotrichaceae bacterium]